MSLFDQETTAVKRCPKCGYRMFGPYACPCGMQPAAPVLSQPLTPVRPPLTEIDVRRIVCEEVVRLGLLVARDKD